MLRGLRAPTQRAVLRALLRGRSTTASITPELGLTRNAVNIALHELTKRGAVERVSRGKYRVKENLVALVLLDRVEKLERKTSQKRGARTPRWRRPRSTSEAASTSTLGDEPR